MVDNDLSAFYGSLVSLPGLLAGLPFALAVLGLGGAMTFFTAVSWSCSSGRPKMRLPSWMTGAPKDQGIVARRLNLQLGSGSSEIASRQVQSLLATLRSEDPAFWRGRSKTASAPRCSVPCAVHGLEIVCPPDVRRQCAPD